MRMKQDDARTLEDLIDHYSLRQILEEIAVIAHEKSDHVLSNWQDENLASRWTAAGNYLEKAANSNSIRRLI